MVNRIKCFLKVNEDHTVSNPSYQPFKILSFKKERHASIEWFFLKPEENVLIPQPIEWQALPEFTVFPSRTSLKFDDSNDVAFTTSVFFNNFYKVSSAVGSNLNFQILQVFIKIRDEINLSALDVLPSKFLRGLTKNFKKSLKLIWYCVPDQEH